MIPRSFWSSILILTLIINAGFFSKNLFAQTSNPQAFQKALSYADSMYRIKDYKSALAAYQYASRLNSGESKVQTKIRELEVIVNQQNAFKEQVNQLIYQAERYIRENSLKEAQIELEKAGKLLPADPDLSRVTKNLQELISKRDALERAYSDTLSKADNYLKNNYFNRAIVAYQHAKQLKNEPGIDQKLAQTKSRQQQNKTQADELAAKAEQYLAENQMDKALDAFIKAYQLHPEDKNIKAKMERTQSSFDYIAELNSLYNKSLSEAEEAFLKKDYAKATKKYNEALDFRPDEELPKQRIRSMQNEIASAGEKEQRYNESIVEGERFLSSKKYEEALSAFENAISLKPEEKLPKTRISEIKTQISKIKSNNEFFASLLSQADALYISGRYSESKATYEKALGIKSDSPEALKGIYKIDSSLNSLAIAENNFKKIVQRADEHFKSSRLNEAISAYAEALLIKPDDKYSIQKTQEARKILNERREKSDLFQLAITNGDLYFQQKNLNEALEEYQRASRLKPDEDYPKQKISEISEILKLQAFTLQQYNGFVKQADIYLKQKKYIQAKSEYVKANGIIPSEKYPVKQIAAIDSTMAIEADLSQKYQDIILLADNNFSSGNLIEAADLYKKALNVKPGENYPTGRISLINKLIADKKQSVEDAYRLAMSNADKLQLEQIYDKALIEYETALSVKPESGEAVRKIAEIKKLIVKQANDKKNYASFLKAADSLYDIKIWNNSITNYRKALDIFPNQEHPKNRITEIEMIIEQIKKKEDNYNESIRKAEAAYLNEKLNDALTLFRQASDYKPEETYPKQKIEEITLRIKAQTDKALALDECKKRAADFEIIQNWDEALQTYLQCQKIESNDLYINNKVTTISQKINDRNALNATFNSYVKSADSLFALQSYENAKIKYQEAANIRPDNKTVQTRISEINVILQKQKDNFIAYKKNLKSADSAFEARSYNSSLKFYLEARKYQANDTVVNNKIQQINALLTKPREVEGITYDKAMVAALKFEQANEIDKAYEHYLIALHLEPHQEAPKESLRKIIALITSKPMITLSEKVEVIPAGTTKSFSIGALTSKNDNYIVIKLSESVAKNGKLIVNFGRGNAVLGGVVLRLLQNQEFSYYVANLSSQSAWTEQSNQWIRVAAENANVNLSGVFITGN